MPINSIAWIVRHLVCHEQHYWLKRAQGIIPFPQLDLFKQVLPFGMKNEIEEEVKLRINALARGGGYILAPAHNVQAGVPPALTPIFKNPNRPEE